MYGEKFDRWGNNSESNGIDEISGGYPKRIEENSGGADCIFVGDDLLFYLLLASDVPRRNHRWSYYALSFQLKTTVWAELSGSAGDLGTYIPIVLALTLANNLDLSSTLIFTAFYNIVTGFLFGIPMPVQPMKSIAAVAISEFTTHLTIPQIMVAGISTAATLFVLGVIGVMSWLYKYIPLPVVREIQLSQGLSFAFSTIKYIRYNQNFVTGESMGSRAWIGVYGLIVAIAAVLFLVLVNGSGDDSQGKEDGEMEMMHVEKHTGQSKSSGK